MMYNEEKNANILIRRLENRDTNTVLKAISAAAEIYCTNSGIAKSQIEAGKESPQTIQNLFCSSLFYGAEQNSQIAGTIRLTFPSVSELLSFETYRALNIDTNDMCSYISRFYVNPDMHGSGIGSQLVSFAENKARKEKAVGIFLHSAVSNKEMLSFYQKRGFRVVASENTRGYERGIFYKDLKV